jgi:GMP synthase (glutamine-hydrolysing)
MADGERRAGDHEAANPKRNQREPISGPSHRRNARATAPLVRRFSVALWMNFRRTIRQRGGRVSWEDAGVRLLAIEHEDDAGAGVFAAPILERDWELETWRPPRDPAAPDLGGFDAVIAFGGAMNVDQEAPHPWLATERALLADAIAASTPTLGVCLGSQLLSAAVGGAPGRAPRPEIGWFDVELTPEGRADPLLSVLPERFQAFQWHSYMASPPSGATQLAQSPVCLQAFRTGEAAWGIQFHAEVTETDALTWTAHHADDPDFARIGLDPEVLAAQITERMPTWNGLGAGLCDRFCELVSTRV